MEYCTLETSFNFGEYKGKTIKEVLDFAPSYINWCIMNNDRFLISDNALEEIQSYEPDFKLSKKELNKLIFKNLLWENELNGDNYDPRDDFSDPRDSQYYNSSLDMDQQEPEFWDDI